MKAFRHISVPFRFITDHEVGQLNGERAVLICTPCGDFGALSHDDLVSLILDLQRVEKEVFNV